MQILPKVIEYDRYQLEFYKDTLLILKKNSNRKVKEGIKFIERKINNRDCRKRF